MKITILILLGLIISCHETESATSIVFLKKGDSIPLNQKVRVNQSGVYLIPANGRTLRGSCSGTISFTIKYSPVNTQTITCNNVDSQKDIDVDNVGIVTIDVTTNAFTDLELSTN